MKKWLTFILLLITLTGTFYPCCLVDECNDEEVTTAQKENKQEPESNCSPFFACATCPGFTYTSKTIQLIQPEQSIQVHYPNAISFSLSTYSSSLLQPPRIA